MKFSIIIPNWNGKKFLKVCLDSLGGQTFRDFEIIIVDNGSTDSSCAFIKANYPEVRVIALDKNYGFSRAANEGINKAKGNFVFLLNNDTEVDPNCLSECHDALTRYPDVLIFAVRIMNYFKRNIMDSAGICYPKSGRAYNIGIGDAFSSAHNQEKEVFGFCAAGAVINKSVFQKIGYFDEDFFAYLEDVDFSLRAQLFGYKCMYIPSVIVYHIGSASTKKPWSSIDCSAISQLESYRQGIKALPTLSHFKVYYIHRHVIWTIMKNWPLPLIIKYLPLIIFYDTLGTLNAIIFERTFATLKAKVDAFKYSSKILVKRRWIQKNKKVSAHDIKKCLGAPEKPLKIFRRKRSNKMIG